MVEMANEIVVKNTLAFLFPGNAAQPTLADMGRFVKTLKGDRSMMDTAYKISDEKSVFIRYKCEDAMKFSLENNNSTLPFHYTDGKKVMVRMMVAGGNTRYVRVFDLPPEATDLDLSSVLGKYGIIKRIVRERFPPEIGLDMFSGVRGLYMDIQREIPETLYFRGRRGRIYYQGLKSKCYVCNSDAHLKKACPIINTRQDEKAKQQQPAQKCELELPAGNSVEGTDGAAVPVTTSGTTRKQHNKGKQITNRATEMKRQLSADSETNIQPQEKKKTSIQPECERANNGSIITVPDGLQTEADITPSSELKGGPQTVMDDASESESDLELIDWRTTTSEIQQAWFEKRERKNRRIDRKVERLLCKHT